MIKVLDRIKAHPAVEEISDERCWGDGCWVYLKPGFRSTYMECRTIHEDNWTQCWKAMQKGITQEAA